MFLAKRAVRERVRVRRGRQTRRRTLLLEPLETRTLLSVDVTVDGPAILDPTFGIGGSVIYDVSPGDEQLRGLAVQSDGKLVAIGYAEDPLQQVRQLLVARFNNNGTLDPSFSGDGLASEGFFGGTAYPNAVVIQAGGRIIVGGRISNPLTVVPPHAQYELALVGYTANGDLDATFGSGGMVIMPVASSNTCTALALQGEKILAAGISPYDGNHADFGLARFNADGTLDASFGTAGVVTNPFGPGADNYAASMAVQSDGRIVVAGYALRGAGTDFDVAVARFQADGALDASFGTGGMTFTPLGSGTDDRAWGVAIQGDGRIVVSGTTGTAAQTDEHIMVLRYTDSGQLDTTLFGTQGVVLSPIGSPNGGGVGGGLAMEINGTMVTAGTAELSGTPALNAFLVGRLRLEGQPDVTFGNNGWLTQSIAGNQQATCVALSGRDIYVGGQASTGGSWQSALNRWTKGPITLSEGDTLSGSGWIYDLAAGGWNAVVNYGDSPDWLPLDVNPFLLSHKYQSRGAYTLTVNAVNALDGVTIEGSDTVRVVVQNAPPEAHPDVFTAIPGQILNAPAPGVLANDSDIGGQLLTAELLSPPAGTINFLPDGSFSYTMPAGWRGPDQFTYRAWDGEAYSNDVAVWLLPAAGVTIVPQAALVTSATQTTTGFQVMLDRPPTNTVTIHVSSSDTTEGTVSPAVLTFTPENGMLPQTVTVTQATEVVNDGRVGYTIDLSSAASLDPDYQALAPLHVAAVNLDSTLTPTHYEFVNTAGLGEITVSGGGGGIPITLLGHSAVDVTFDGAKGAALDLTGNGRDEVVQQLTQLEMSGTVRGGGPVNVRLGSRPSWGQLEEQSQALAGQLDLPPYAYGAADPTFELFLEVDYMGGRLVNLQPARFQATVHQAPAANNDTLTLVGSPVDLVDGSGAVVAQLTSLSVIFQAQLSNLGGQKWEDLNANGVHEGGELGLNDWVIALMQGITVVSAQVTHDIDVNGDGQIDPLTERGRYRFENLAPGTYQIVELSRAGWARTVPGVCPPLPPAFLGPAAHWLDMLPEGYELMKLYSFADVDWNLDGLADEQVMVEGGFEWGVADGLLVHVAAPTGDPTQVAAEMVSLSMAGLGDGHWLRFWAGNPAIVDPTGQLGLTAASTGLWTERSDDPGLVDAHFAVSFVLGISADGPVPLVVGENVFQKLHSAAPIQIAATLDRLTVDGVLWDSQGVSPQGVDLLDAVGEIRGRLLRLRSAYADFATYGAGPAYSITVATAVRVDTLDFANVDLGQVASSGTDYGDAPAPYPEAAHAVDGRTFLGLRLDVEPATPVTPEADDDGVQFLTPLLLGQSATIAVLASSQNPAGGYLNAWFDFNADGDWSDAGEQIFTDSLLLPGSNTLSFTLPDLANGGVATPAAYARFRFTSAPGGGLPVGGPAPDGEVEDYCVAVDQPVVSITAQGWTITVAPTNFQGLRDAQGNVYPVGLIGWTSTAGATQSNQVEQQWYWYRIDDAGPEHPLDELPLTSVQTTANQITLNYGAAGDPFSAVVTYSLPSAAGLQLATVLTSNRENLNLHWFSLAHLRLDREFGGNVATLVGAGSLHQVSAVQSTVDLNSGVGVPNQQTVDAASALLALLGDGAPTNVAPGNTTAGPGDVAALFQRDFPPMHSGDSVAASASGAGQFADVQLPTPPPPAEPPPPPDELNFKLDLLDLRRRWFDPAIALGYDYRENSALKIATVMLPTGFGDNHYMLYLPDGLGGFQTTGIALDGGVEYAFTDADPAGVSSFRILGIEPTAGVDPADPVGFPTGITYVTTGETNLTMRGIPQFVYVDQYGTFAEEEDLGGLPGIEAGDKVAWQSGTPNAVTGLIFGATAFNSPTAANDYLAANQLTGLTTVIAAAPAEIHGYVFDDLDGDGARDSGEPIFPGVPVQLLDAGGVIIGQQATNASGRYSFTSLGTGTYTITADLPGPASAALPLPLALQAGQVVVAEAGLAGAPGSGQQEVVNSDLKLGTIYVASIHGVKFNDAVRSGQLAVQSNVISQDFDGGAAPALPGGWTAAGDVAWVTNLEPSDTGPNAAYIPNCVVTTDNALLSPAFTATGNLLRLSFRHSYNLEALRDGGALEVSVDGGAYVDVLAAGGSFQVGGYANSLDASVNPLAGRPTWTGDSGGFVTTVLTLPTAAGAQLQFRWRLGTDASGGASGGGWHVDTVRDVSVDKPLMPGVVIRLTGDANGDGTPDALETTTDANGEFHFLNLFPGQYTVSEISPAHTRPTTNTAVIVAASAGQALTAFAGQALSVRPKESESVVIGLRFGNNAVTSSCGVYDPTQSLFFLKFDNREGFADLEFGFGAPGWKPLAGDWNADGRDTIGLFQPEAAQFYLRNSNSSGDADVSFGYGDASQGDQYLLVMGDWNGDGVDTIGLYHKPSAAWFLRNSNSQGNADITFGFGVPGSGWMPVVGDWDGDGVVTIGLYDPATGMFYLRNSHSTGMADIAFPYGAIGAGWTPLIGDWDGDGLESAGFYQSGAASHFYLRNAFTAGMADVHFGLGYDGCLPIVGNWLGTTGQTLLAENGSAASAALVPRPQLLAPQLAPLISAALARWAAAGTSIAAPHVVLTDLPGAQLGKVENGQVYLDRDAAGHGWFIDPTPAVDEEFARLGDGTQLTAIDSQAADKIDLLTVIEHELGHLAGLGDLDTSAASMMSGLLPTGVRRLATAQEIDNVFAEKSVW